MLKRQFSLLKSLFINRVRRVPSKLNLNITSLCNSQCRTCNVWTAYRQHPEKLKNELTEDEIRHILGFSGLPIWWLAITGGEPFLRQDLERILLFVVHKCPSIKMLTIPSNGLDKKRILSCLEKVKDQKRLEFYINFSLDGPPEIHDFIRGIQGGFEKTWETYTELRQLVGGNKHFHVGFETTISQYNISHVNTFIRTLIEQGHNVAVTIAHNAQFYKNMEDEPALLPLDSAVVKALAQDFDQIDTRLSPEKIFRRIYLKNCPAYIENPISRILTCSALQTSLAIDPYGTVFPCLMWNHAIGNVREHDYNIMAIWNAAERQTTRKLIVEGRCPNCWTPCEAYLAILENFYRLSVMKNIL